MNKTTLAAALATMTLAVPAGWQMLDADIQTDGPKIRPSEAVLHLDGVEVSLQIDRGAVVSGGTVSAIMVATAATPQAVSVDLTTSEDMGIGAERVSNPPLQVDRRTIKLQAQPGGGPPVVATVKLGSKKEKPGDASWYDLYLTKHGVSAPKYAYEAQDAAHAGVTTFSKNSFPISIEAPAAIPVEGPFTIAVRVKNTTKHGWSYTSTSIGGGNMNYSGMEGFTFSSDDYDIEKVEAPEGTTTEDLPTDADGDTIRVAPGAEDVTIYKVIPKRFGIDHFQIVAMVHSSSSEPNSFGAAMDVKSFDRPAAPEPDAVPAQQAAPQPVAAR